MKDISLFDVIGPNMIGPSSSHTAGALRIAALAYKMMRGTIVSADFVLYGSFAKTYKGHGTDRALLAGVMGFGTEDERIGNAFEIADRQGLQYSFTTDEKNKNVHPNTVRIKLKSDDGHEMIVMGESIGGGNVQITQIDDVKLMFTGQYSTLIISNIDHAGVIAHITSTLGNLEINIAFMRTYREEKGKKAYTILETDEKIDPEVADLIKLNKYILDAKVIEM
ncbi:MAG: L-serine ammonia-lyase, iron-sulfur-dependent subunit beta [Peptostreptococcaceae bacterium]|nr:L-serine ammonia-lyase, iron-sulfur-dependent subunit beta [Peptostreptococcaceae bacterium]